MSRATLQPAPQIIPRQAVGNTRRSGHHFQLSIRVAKKSPVIRCSETGRLWEITWDRLIDLAIAEGITHPHGADQDDEP